MHGFEKHSFDTPHPITAILDLVSGRIRLIAADRGDTSVDVRPADPGKRRDAEAAEKTGVEFADGVLRIRTVGTENRYLGLSGNVEITVELPAGSRIEAKTADCELSSVGRLGDVVFEGAYRQIKVEEAASLHLTAVDGDVEVSWLGGPAHISTAQGAIRIDEVVQSVADKGTNRGRSEVMSSEAMLEYIAEKAKEFGIPGVAVGVWKDGQETFACWGVTSVENPLPVTPDTVFLLGSVSKTFTATTVMRLAADGKIDLDAPVREYVPELQLADEQVAARMTIANLLNHTAGLGVRLVVETGDGDDALAAYVTEMADISIIGPVGGRASYSQSGYNLLGRVIEKVTGQTFEQAVTEVCLAPAGMADSTYRLNDVMVRRFAAGHNADDDGTPVVAKQWKDTRANNPGGGLASTVSDLLRWARVHLNDGRAADGTAILPADAARAMRQPTVKLQASSLGDAFGICWFLRDVDGVAVVGHGGSGNGQFADLQLVPERDFAIAVTTNAGPGGVALNQLIVRWALEHFLGVVDKDPEPAPFDQAKADEIAGLYEVDVMFLKVAVVDGGLTLTVWIKPEIREASDVELPADYPPFEFGLLPGEDDEYIVTGGAMAGQRGFFTRDETGAIIGCDLAGRMFTLVD